jgi:tetratricopeptide (TPR) repeat protein
MIKKILILCVFFSLSLKLLLGQEQKSLLSDKTIYVNELVFNSLQEADLFKAVYQDKSEDYFSLNYLVKKEVNASKIEAAKAKVAKKIENFNSRNIKSKAEKKIVKIIYKEVHAEFLKKYELNNHFDDVFNSGYYNCLSATFLYAFILEALEIPYQINRLPNHVNITTYPETHQIIIEATDPVKGYFAYDTKFKQLYVANLVTYKLIDKIETETLSTAHLFEKYYHSNDQVSLKELIGSQYYNDGIYLTDEKKNEAAIQQLEKAIALHPSLNTAHILMSLYAKEIEDTDYSNKTHFEYMLRLLRYSDMGIDQESVIYELDKVRRNYLTNKNDTLYFKEAYTRVDSSIHSDSLKLKVKQYYFISLGDYYYNDLRYELSNQFYLKTLNSGAITAKVEDLYIRSLIFHVEDFSNKQMALDYLINGENAYPKIKEHRLYLSYKAEILTWLLMQKYQQNNVKEGELFRNELEQILDSEDVKINENNLGIAYSGVGAYYFKHGNRSKAREMFKKGLEYAPENYELTSRLKMLNN